ncbi:MAG: 3-phenylpropionate MFS transporter [Rhodospirillales bacterium]|nr:3-phenylpropionate MFS transporter [Rhodospirillales bacterium]
MEAAATRRFPLYPGARPPILGAAMTRRALALRYAAYYGTVFLALGVYLPFWPVWLAHRGLAAAEIGLLLALTSWIKVLALPPVARLADLSGRPNAALALLAGLTLAAFSGFFLAEGFAGILTVQLMTALVFHSLIPLGESQTMAAVRRDGLDYGRVRLWGSLAFILGALGAGELLTGRSPELLLWLILAALGATLTAALALPASRNPENTGKPGAGSMTRGSPRLRSLLADRGFLLFIATASLLQASHAVYYGFSALAWRAAGMSEAAVGWLWSEGVLAEILFFWASAPLLRRGGPASLLVLAGLAGLLRWVLLGATTALPLLIAAQALHAFTFGAAHLAAVHFIAERAPPGLSATAQSLYAALSGGLAMGLSTLLAGWLYQAEGAGAFYAMAAMSAAGFALAGLLAWRQRTGAKTFP